MGANGAALIDYDDFLDLILRVKDANGSLDTVIFAPRTKNNLAKIVTGINDDPAKLTPPAGFTARRRPVSHQVAIDATRGRSNTASIAFIGGFNNCTFGSRQNVTIEASRVSGTAFERNEVMARTRSGTPLKGGEPGGGKNKVVAIDKIWVGGKAVNRKGKIAPKIPVLSRVEREGKVRSRRVSNANGKHCVMSS